MTRKQETSNLINKIQTTIYEVNHNENISTLDMLDEFLTTNENFNKVLENYEKLMPGFYEELTNYEEEMRQLKERRHFRVLNLGTQEDVLNNVVKEEINKEIERQKQQEDFALIDAEKCVKSLYKREIFDAIKKAGKDRIFDEVLDLLTEIQYTFYDISSEYCDYCEQTKNPLSLEQFVLRKQKQIQKENTQNSNTIKLKITTNSPNLTSQEQEI